MNSLLQELTRIVVGLTLASGIAVLAVAAEPTSSQKASSPDAKQQLIALERDWVAAENKHDAAALRRILDERFVVTFGADKTYDRESFIGLFTGPVDPTESQTLTYEAVLIDGDTAVLVGTETAHGTKNGAAYKAVYRYTVTYLRRHGQWLALAEHIVKVPQTT
jgi:ketosteroid isomerase-like protein